MGSDTPPSHSGAGVRHGGNARPSQSTRPNGGLTMKPHVSAITLGVKDLNAAKQFYAKGLGWPTQQDYPHWVAFSINGGESMLGLYAWDALAADAGVPANGSGF